MKTIFNLRGFMCLLVLHLGLFGCKPPIDPVIQGSNNHTFALVDSNGRNICKSKENSPYDVDEVYIVMHDGVRLPDLRYYLPKVGDLNYSHHPANKGLVFSSEFLAMEISYVGSKYADKPFYLVLNEEDTDTLMWKSEDERLYHNGEKAGLDTLGGGSPHMFIKGNF